MRRTGLGIVGDVPWGTHFCQFYETSQDLLEILVPYFAAGLEEREACLWVTSGPLEKCSARAALASRVIDFESRAASGQIEILDYTECYRADGNFDAGRVLSGWLHKLDEARARGFHGLRLSGDRFWVERSEWRSVVDYETRANTAIGQYPILSLCTYSLERCGAAEVLDVIGNHEFAVVRQDGKWTVVRASDRKSTREALRRYELLSRHTRDSILYVRRDDGRIVEANPAAQRQYGYSRQEMLALNIRDLRAPETRGLTEKQMADADERGILFESLHRNKEGATFPVEVSSQGATVQGVRVLISVVRDISQRKVQEEALRRSEAVYRSIARSLPGGAVFVVDRDERILAADGGLLRTLGMEREKLEGRTISEALPPEVVSIAGPRCRYALDGGSAEHETQIHERILLTQYAPLRGEDGQVVGALALALDITARKRVDERLRQTQRLESVALLAGGVAHDFNNLLVGIIGNASLASESLPPGSPGVEMMSRVIQAGEQAAHLTRQLLAYAGKGQFVKERVDASALIAESGALLQSSLSKRIALRLRLSPNLPAIESDPSQIRQILMNLVINAGEAIGPEAGAITVTTGDSELTADGITPELQSWPVEPGLHVFLEVRDTGCGMDADLRARIFEPFVSTKFQGRGLGLAAVAGIVRAHKGAITVITSPGGGTTFRVLLPATVAPASSPRTEPDRPHAGKGAILVVDDEEIVRDLAKKTLELHGYEVLVASNGQAAVEAVRRHPERIRLVILDLSMPGLGGRETLAELRRIRPNLEVIVSSGYSKLEALQSFGDARVSGFIQKPYTVRQLAREIQSALE